MAPSSFKPKVAPKKSNDNPLNFQKGVFGSLKHGHLQLSRKDIDSVKSKSVSISKQFKGLRAKR